MALEFKSGETPEIETIVEKLGKAFEDFKRANDGRIAEIEKRGSADPVTDEKVNKLNGEVARLDKELKAERDRVAELEKKAQRPSNGNDNGKRVDPEYKSALFDYMRKGIESKALTSGSDPDGGYTVHPELDSMIDRVARTTIAMRQVATVRTISSRSYKKIVTTSGASIGGWGNETTAPSESNAPTMAELEFTPGTLWAEPRATQELLEDSDQNLEAWLADEVGITFEEQENQAFQTGNGVNRPRGLASYTFVANSSYSWGSVGYTVSGAAADFAASNPSDKLVDLIHTLKPVYRANAQWMMPDATLADIRKFKDGNGIYLWVPGIERGMVGQLLGYPVVSDDQMAAKAANAYGIAFADFKRAYVIVDRVGTQIIRDNLTSKPYVKFYTRRRVGGGIQNFEAVKFLKFST